MTRPTHGMTLFELLFSVALLSLLTLTLGSFVQLSARWGQASQTVLANGHRTARVRAAIGAAAGSGRPVKALSVTARGELREAASLSALHSWEDGTSLILRDEAGYQVISVEDGQLARRRLAAAGAVSSTPLLRGVRDAQFRTHLNASGEPVGVAFQLTFLQGEPAEGFVALRTTSRSLPPIESPSAAPRFGAKGR